MISPRLYLNVPFSEKNIAKSHGAKWDPQIRKWYCDKPDSPDSYMDFLNWILDNRSEAFIATEYIYIIESTKTCWKCHKDTRVIALGVSNYIYFEDDDDEVYITNCYHDYTDDVQPIKLAWVDHENQIPPTLLTYLKNNYNVKMSHSKTAGKCFANHCEHCGSIQGNHFLFEEEDSPFYPYAATPTLLRRKMENITIYSIYLFDDIILDWTIFDFESPLEYVAFSLTKRYHPDFIIDNESYEYGYAELYKK